MLGEDLVGRHFWHLFSQKLGKVILLLSGVLKGISVQGNQCASCRAEVKFSHG